MPILFLIFILIVPFWVTYLGYSKEFSIGDLFIIFFTLSILYGWLFHLRLIGRACARKVYSFEDNHLLGLGAGLSGLAGVFASYTTVMVILYLIAASLIIWTLNNGPACGWET